MIDLDELLPGICNGDHHAFARWMAGAELPLWRSLRPFAASVDTEGVMQETFLRVWLLAPRCEPDGKGNSLLRMAHRVARNLAIDETRRRNRESPWAGGKSGAVGPPGSDRVPEPIDPAATPDPLLRKRIAECFEKLPGKPLEAISARLNSWGRHSDKVLAENLGMRLNTFLQNITRARRLLAECLLQYGIELERLGIGAVK